MLVLGALLLGIALVNPLVKRLPITTTIIYLLVGVALSPLWLGLLEVDPFRDVAWLHHGAELAVLVSLFGVGMKLRMRLGHALLRPALSLAVVSMVVTVGLVAATGYWLMGLPVGAAVLLGAVLAPTDPVLASDVQLRHAADRDRVRLTLSAEAGLNDGTAFPFVLMGLALLNPAHSFEPVPWLLRDVIWAGLGGLAIGSATGFGVGTLVLSLQRRRGGSLDFGEYLVMGLVGVSYGLASALHTYGFLAVFAAGVGLRAVERRASAVNQISDTALTDDTARLPLPADDPRVVPVYLAGTLQSTNQQLEHILEAALVLVVGASLWRVGVSGEALWFAPLLFLVIRPLACVPLLFVHRFTRLEAGAVAWFGIRGIGSLFYVTYSIDHGLPREVAGRLVSLTLAVIAVSILVHGISVTPLLDAYHRRKPPR